MSLLLRVFVRNHDAGLDILATDCACSRATTQAANCWSWRSPARSDR